MSVGARFPVLLPNRKPVDIVVVELEDGRIVTRSAGELEHASDEIRLAAGLPPRQP